ncbi:MAG: cytochrome c-type biogenesis protein CcmH [Acidimicrobiales bacterium]
MSAARRVLWLLLLVAGVAALSIAALDSPPETTGERIQRLADSYACPTCKGQTVAESNASAATVVRDFIRVSVDQGRTDEEIRDLLVQSYGGRVLLTPRADGISALIWILPAVVAIGGGAVVVASLRRSPPAQRVATDADRELVAAAKRSAQHAPGEGGS